MVWDGVIIFIAIITALVLWLRWNYSYWKKKGIPYVEPSIVFGNVKEATIGKLNIGIVSQQIYTSFPNEPVIGYFRMRTPVLQIKDHDLIKMVLITNFNSFRNSGLSISRESDPIFGRNPFFLKDDEWKEARRILTRNHTASKLKCLYGYVDEVKDELISYLNNHLGEKFDAKDFCERFTTDIVSSCVFGIKTRSYANEESEFRKISGRLLDINWRFILWQMAPALVNALKIRLLKSENHDYFYNLVKSIVELRREKNLSRTDFLQNLINDNENLSVMDMTAQTMAFFIDGYLSSATEMSFMLYMLAIHPDVQERLRDEIKTAEKLDFDTIHHLPYMDAVFNETLRIYPTATALGRQCNEDIKLTSKNKTYEFKKGDMLEIPVYAIHRDEQYFPDPLKFDPARFLIEPNNPFLLTFGAGPRACLGSRFAKTQIKAGIAALVKNFRIIPGTNDWSMPITTNNKSFLLSADNEMWVKFERI